MLVFELKKMWRKKTFLLMVFFSVALAVFINYRSEYIVLEEEYPQYESEQASLMFRIKFKEKIMERSEQRKSVAEMMPEDRQLKAYSKKMRELLEKIPQPYCCGYSEEGLEIERIQLEQMEYMEELQKKYQFSFTPSEKMAWDWALFEMKYARENDVHTMTGCWQNHLSNATRRILFNSRYLFGLPVIFFFIFLFSGIVSLEHETGTIQFLQMQPLPRLRILITKFGAMWVSALLYLLILFSVLGISFVWLRLPMDGLREIYRVLDGGETVQYLTGAQLLFRLLFAYLMSVTFFSSLIFLVSVGTSNSERIILKVFSLLAVIWVFTENFSAFQHAWNPIYCMDYLRILIGKIDSSMGANGT